MIRHELRSSRTAGRAFVNADMNAVVADPPRSGSPAPLRRLEAIRYVKPLREGGSVPAIVELEGGELFVMKLRGAGQGVRALVAEIIVGQLGRSLGLPVPELVLVTLDEALARTERDQEIQELLVASVGLNVGLAYLSGALMLDAAAPGPGLDAELASRIVMFDAYTTNVDRTARNPNLLEQAGKLWLIDHGAALYWHHDWDGGLAGADRKFPLVKDHVLLRWADALPEASRWLARGLDDRVIEAAVAEVPAAWLDEDPVVAEARRAAYVAHLRARREAAQGFVQEAIDARARL
jgi:hypothetical protein